MAMVVYQQPTSLATNETIKGGTNEDICKYRGLSNQGATCYLNGLLQTLFMTPEFRKAIFTWNYNIEKDGKEDLCIPLQLQRLFGMLQLSKQRSVDTVALTKSFGWDSSEVFQQQDVQELTRVLFDALEESFKGTDVENIIDELYAGELIDYLRCIDVDHQSERKDKFLDFSLAIVPFGSDKAMHSLTECIEMFLRPEILNGDNKYYAEKFDRKVDALKGLKFGRLPQIMSVQLKRFVYDFSGVDIVQKKLNDVVKFPMVLDMNKYVASKRRQTSAQDDGEEVCFDPNEEFEAFLTEQMDVLNSETKSAEKVCVSADGSSSGMDYFNMTDIDEDPVEAVPVPEEEHVSMDDDMPPLVDFTGMRAPDQVEEDALKVAQEAAAERERVLYGSLSEEAVRSLLTERGEWIYELYAVLIHSGAISGGHYYAYIKDLETQRWQNFNDSSVEPIDEQKVRQAWGENISVASYGTYPVFAKGPIKTRLSSANAYMLMYRQVTPASLGRVTFPPADSVPQYIQELVHAEEKARLERAREEEEQRNRLRIKVWWDAKEHVVVTSRTATFRNFMCAVWTQLNVGPHLMEQDSMQKGTPLPETVQMDSSSPSDESKTSDGVTESEPRFDRFRLRIYNQYNKSRGEAVDLEASGHKPLSELLINEYKHLILETRTSSLEDYEVFFKDGVSLQVEVFQTHTQTFGDTRCVRLPKGSLLLDLKHHLALSSPLTPGRMTLFKMIPLGQVEARMEVLGDDTKRLREDLNMFEGFKIFAEETPEEGVASPAWQAVMKSRSHLNVLVNKPPGVAFEFLVEGDLRWKVSELRAKVLDVLGLDPTVDIRLFKGSSRGQELREDGLTLMSNAVYAGMNIFVSLGKALRVGVHQLLVMQYTPTEGKTGVVPLPFLESEDFEETPRSSVVGSVYPSSGAKGWEAAATCNLKDIHVNIDRLGDLITDSSDPPLLAFPAPDTSDAAAAAGMYRMCGRQEDSDEGEGESTPCSVDEEVALRGLVDLAGATDEVFRGENIHNLIHTQELTAVQGADGRYGHSPHLAEEAVLLVVGEEKEEDMYAAPIVLSDSHANLVSPDTVAIVPEATLSFEQTVVCTACSADPPFSESEPKEVEPSGFGELSVKNQSPVSSVFESLDALGVICVEASTPVADLRQTLLERLVAAGKLPQGASPRLVRLRDKVGSNPGKVLRDGRTLGDSKVYLFDQKSIAVQLLDVEEDTALLAAGTDNSDVGDALIHIQRWNRSTWSMGNRFEVLLRGSMSVRDVARALGRLTDIPVDSMLALVVPRDSELFLSELQMKTPTRNYGRGWFCPGKERKLLKYMSHELKVQDGDLLILQDVTEPLRELSPADLRSIAIVEAAANDYSVDSYPTASYAQATSYLYNGPQNMFAGPTPSKSGAAAGGVKIKTHQERLRESEKQQADAASTPTDNNPADDSLDGASSSSSSSATEMKEVQQQAALFDDLQ